MITRMNTGSHEFGVDEQAIEYGEEVMCAGWNPAVNLVSEQLEEVLADEQLVTAEKLAALSTPDDVAAAVSDIFLKKIYSSQR